MQIRQFRYGIDNLGYLVYEKTEVLAIDGGAVEAILAFVRANRLSLKFIVNTHGHTDHTSGNRQLARQSDAALIDMGQLTRMGRIDLAGRPLQILPTPGHTRDSVCLQVENALITGDTLFNGTVGNCFSGDLRAFYRSIKTLMAFPPETVIYAGHDYVRESMAFAATLAGDATRKRIDAFLQSYDPARVRSTLAQEQAVNPYLRFNTDEIRLLLERQGLPVETEYQRWCSIMSLG